MMNEHGINGIEVMKVGGDLLSLSTLIAYFTGALPVIATLLTIVWTALRIYEMDTVQRWLGKDKKNGDQSSS